MTALRLTLLVVAAAGAVAAGALAMNDKSPLAGAYDLRLDHDTSWHRGTLELADDGAHGTVVIDLGLGPEGRAPTPDEKAWRLPFTTVATKSGALRFEVVVGAAPAQRWSFELFDMGDDGTMVGVVEITAVKGQATSGRRGVLVRRQATRSALTDVRLRRPCRRP